MTEELRGHRGQSSSPEQMGGEGGRSGIAQKAQEATGQVTSTARDQARSVAAEAGQQARDLASEARQQVRDQAHNQQQQAADRLHAIGDELDTMADKGGQSGVATDLAKEASRRIHRLASWLQDREPGDLVDSLRESARRRPGMFLAGAALAGVVAGRLTRSAVAQAGGNGQVGDRSGRREPEPGPTAIGAESAGTPSDVARVTGRPAAYEASATRRPPVVPGRETP